MNKYQRALENLEQTNQFERTVELSREGGLVDMESGRFPMVLATEGEASDGHIIGIKGIETQERMVMLFGHRSTETVPTLGSVIEPVKSRKDGIPVLRQTGVFNLAGEGPLAAVRRDIAQLVNDGDLDRVSFRWDGIAWERRINLSKDHPHYVDASKIDHNDERYWGVFFSKSRALEGSLVAIGADPKAIVGRAQKTDDTASKVFLRALASRVDEQSGLAELSAGFDALQDAFGSLERLGVSNDEIALCMANEAAQVDTYNGYMIPTDLARQLRERDELMVELLPQLLRSSTEEVETPPAEEAGTPAPEGAPSEARDDEPRYEDGSIGAMDAEDFFTGVRGAMTDAVGESFKRILGRR